MTDRIIQLLTALFSTPEYKSCFIVDIEVRPPYNIQAFIDSDEGITLVICKSVSRYLESFLDEEIPEGKYSLEVSSPGLSRPLKLSRQYIKNVGRDIIVETLEGEHIEGKMTAADEQGFTVQTQHKEKIDNKKVLVTREITLLYTDIKEVKIAIKF
ncbi:MAG TPA: ribosome assembly cofactor RimP [Saprospiraceae bacterium]|nr:ribosome assembly cofactor RimP [Saprospiraceae bacterium]HQW55928.1 ribosome assembly cofactor RimP [Saprospiraceae bacterium]